MTKIKAETCKAVEMLEQSEVLSIYENLIHNWQLDTLDCEDDESVFECSFTDEEGYVIEFVFTKKALVNAEIKGHSIFMIDDTDEEVEVNCFSLTPVSV